MDRAGAAQLDGNWVKAIDYCTRAIEVGWLSDDDLYHAFRIRGQSHSELGHYALAVADLDSAIRIRPDYIAGYTERARIHEEQDNHEAAVADYSRGLAVHPHDDQMLRQRAMSLSRLGRRDEVWADLRRMAELDPDPNDSLTIIRTTAVETLDYHQRNLDELDSAIREYPENFLNYAERARLHEKRGALREAILDYTTAVHLQMVEAQKTRQDGHKLALQGSVVSVETAAEYYKEADQAVAFAVALVEKAESLKGGP